MRRSLLLLGLLELRGALGDNTRVCIANTGIECPTMVCGEFQGICDSGRCMCDDGSCAGSDLTCYDSTNKSNSYKHIGGRTALYNIRNALRTDQYLISRQLDGLTMTSQNKKKTSTFFALYMLPTSTQDQVFLLYPDSARTSAVLVLPNKTVRAVDITAGADYGYDFDDIPLPDLGLKLWLAPEVMPGKSPLPLVMVSTASEPYQFLFSSPEGGPNGTPLGVWGSDPGAAGYWSFEPALPRDFVQALPVYDGQRCAWSCGGLVGSARRPAGTAAAAAAIAALAALAA